ncbi:short-chain dehydrogenase/reductase SDR [Novosphingobium aromaticivorans DSM 12444]|uniref:Short-chain dehydrogenase/reductase SDR n=1 Tax=Novosphingobium aromaticivorans (strain ATCC 700278 / DSM 12444 / CCUG 56034 / CIP 105152 / NBRC 16084 / F199) TaxID=279238 RepID=Q2G9B1_NOVAD|nr:SDR family oxidoreductase [Novosphingobium aromaticivorans]ABD25562.1 short-chain dehydrogenase/reductase SDR [Novosphingobium aromaticivorans DSM 12444]SCX97258.1 NADP-dependent 3-hydroxy acid dehydrogenase YdfG [Novosphingobium aromaticivorans]
MGKTIFITGGASGIGRAVAQRFGQGGWFVGIADIDEGGMMQTAAMLPSGRSSRHKLDVRDRSAWDAALADCARAGGGRIDVVFNNAGIPIGGAIADLAVEEIERTLDINLKGVIFGAQAAYPWLRASAPGSVLLNTASAAGIYGSPGASVYSATKFGVRAITESLDGEWAEDGIRVRDLMPGFIETPLLDHAPNRASNEDIRSRVRGAGLEITPVSEVAEAAWAAVHGERLHTLVGKTARRLAFASRWMPGALRKQMRSAERPLGK